MTQQAEPVQDKPLPPKLLIAVRYGYLGWVGEFRHSPALKLKYTDLVVVKTERGLEIGTPVAVACSRVCSAKCVRPEQQNAYVQTSGEDHLQRGAGEVIRVASAEDLAEQRRIDSHARDKLAFCGQAAAKVGLTTHMIACEHLLGGERIIFYFTAEGRIDFRQLVRDLAREYHTRIEMRQIGARDEARIVADFEICGRECCCKNFLKVLRPVNMKMAKLQKATLDPTKVSGRCGRLRCCLRYEQLTYEELDAKLPDIGVRVRVSQGIGFIRERQVITQLLVLDMGEGRRLAVPLEEIQQIVPEGEIIQSEERRPLRRRGPADDEAGEEGDVPVARRDGPDAEEEVSVIGEEGKPAEPGEPRRLPPPRRGSREEAREPGREGSREGGRDNTRETPRDGGNGRPPRRQGRGRGEGRPRADGRAADARGEAPRSSDGREGAPDGPLPVEGNAAAPGPSAGDSGPRGAGSTSNPQGSEGGAARPGRRRRRRGRRPRGEGQPPRADNNPPPPQ